MKNNYSTTFLIFFTISSIVSPIAQGQNKIKWEEIPNLAQKIKDGVPEGKALFVFEAKEDYLFDSDNENIVQPKKEGLLYKLMIDIEPPSGKITIKHEGGIGYINYGKPNFAGSLPVLKNKEIKYFRLSSTSSLGIEDVTAEKDSLGATDFQGLNNTDAMIIFYPIPEDLIINFTSNLKITTIVNNPGEYKLYVEPKVQNIVLNVIECEPKVVEIKSSDSLISKKVKYYMVYGPIKAKTVSVNDATVGKGNFKIESTPPGALIEIEENPAYTILGKRTPDEMQGYKSGLYNIKLSLDKHETYTGQINIGSKDINKLSVTMVPKFGYINVNVEPAIPTTMVYLDNVIIPNIQNGINLEKPKGSHILKFEAPHYYTEERPVELAPGEVRKINVKLKPKMGSLSILSGINASGAEVLINGNRVGKIPISNLALQEGSYEVRFKRSDFISEKSVYTIEVLESKLTNFRDLKMINTRKVHITTSPVSGATVYIDNDNIPLSDKTNLYVTLGIGDHSIKVEREHYKPYSKNFTVDQENEEFNFELEELSYTVSFYSKPSNSNVIIDGVLQGRTPISIQLPLGSHRVKLENDGYLNKTKTLFVTEPSSLKTKLFPSSYLILGADYGLDQYRFSAGYVIKGVLISFGMQYNESTNKEMTANNLGIENVTVEDINLYDEEDGRIYVTASKSLSFNAKLGFTVKKPFVFLLTIGCSNIQTDKFQKIYTAKHDYIGENYGDIIIKGNLFSVPYYSIKTYTVFTTGIMLPITNWIYCSADYYSNSDIGSGVSFGLGFMLRKR